MDRVRDLRHDAARWRAVAGRLADVREKLEFAQPARAAERRRHRGRLPGRLPGRLRGGPADRPRDRRARSSPGLARGVPEDIDRCWEAVKDAERPRIHTFISTSDIHLSSQFRMTRERGLERGGRDGGAGQVATARTSSSRRWTPRAPTGTTCTSARGGHRGRRHDHQHRGHRRLRHAGRVRRADRAASASKVRERRQGDRSRSTATTTWAWRSPTRWRRSRPARVRSSARINGIGERAGNASLEEIVMALNVAPGLLPASTTSVDASQI